MENIYKNPSGFTDIPWQLSLEWFKNLVHQEIAQMEQALQSKKSSPIDFQQCPNCGWNGVDPARGFCFTCGKATDAYSEFNLSQLQVVDHEYLNHRTDDPEFFRSLPQEEVMDFHNFIVDVLRNVCDAQVRSGHETLQVREGLRVSREWDAHFRNLFNVQPKVMLWLAVKHSMLGNPLAGEVLEWKNDSSAKPGMSGKGKLAGAAALGVLAGFLFS